LRRASYPTQLVFQALLDASPEHVYGVEMIETTGLPSGTIYPILDRLEHRDLVTSHWIPVQAGTQRRHRRYYSLTEEGRHVAQRETAEHRDALRLLLTRKAPDSAMRAHEPSAKSSSMFGEVEIDISRRSVSVAGEVISRAGRSGC
jgi:PadR family transcriptional regulator, regulatory protein PadR